MVKIKEVMKRHVITGDKNVDISTIAKIMTNNKIGSVVVIENEKPVDIITTEDIVWVVANGFDTKKTTVKDVLKRKKRGLIFANSDDNLLDVVRKMVKTGVKRVPVLENGKLVGIVSDKEILVVSPELIEILSEKLKSRIEESINIEKTIAGICEKCGQYSDELKYIDSIWICEECASK